MGCCLGVLLLGGAPRLALALWWFMFPSRITETFAAWTAGTPAVPVWVWPLAGILLMPWLTIAYVWVAPGGITGIEWAILFVALLFDLGTHGGSGREARRRSKS